MRCLPIHSVKDLTDFLAREHFAAEERETAARGFFPCSLFMEELSPDLAESLLARVKQTGGWGHIRRAPDGGPRGSGLLLCCPLDALGAVSDEIRNAVGPDERDHVENELEGLVRQMTREGPPPVRYRGKTLDFSRGPVLMAVLNVTPDSFFDGGRYRDTDKAVQQGLQLIRDGAHILDVGGASSRPGSDLVPDEEQLERILPVIREIRKQWDGWISVDTFSAPVARAAVGEGADMINDISAGRIDPEMMQVAGETGVPAVLMHMKGTPRDMQKNPVYRSLLPEMLHYFEDCIRAWENA